VLYQNRYTQNVDIAVLLREARREAGLSQAATAERAGTSQPTLAAYESGRLTPRLETLSRILEATGHELSWEIRPKVRRGAVPMAAVSRDLRRILRHEGERGAWRRLLDFLDDFRASPRAGQAWLVAEEPRPCGDARFDAAMAAMAELLCDEAGLPWPDWTSGPGRFAEPWWFVSGLAGFEAMALRDSPIEFKHHGVFVNERAFERV
jgi:transcriptional regulator with XRE-family HTH domain